MSKRHICLSKFHVFYHFFIYFWKSQEKKFINPSCSKHPKMIEWNKKWHKCLFLRFFVVPKKVLWRPQNLFEASKMCGCKKICHFFPICLCPYCRTPDLCHFLSLTIKIHKNRTWSVKNKPNLLAHDSYLFLAPNFGIFLIIVVLQYAPKYIQNPLRRF